MKLRFQTRYLIATLTLLVVMIVINAGVYFVVSEQQAQQMRLTLTANNAQSLQTQLSQRAEDMAAYLAEALFNPLYTNNPEEAYYLLQSAQSLKEVTEVYVVDADGRIFHDGTRALREFGQPYPNRAALQRVLRESASWQAFEDGHLLLGKPVQIGPQLVGGVFMRFSLASIAEEVEQISTLIQDIHADYYNKIIYTTLITAILLIVLGGLTTYLIARSMTRPLHELIRHTERIGSGDFGTTSSIHRQDEIGELASAFNAMGKMLEQHTQEISHLAYHDALTGLPNRARFIQLIDQLIASKMQTHFAVLFIDLDEFKAINDNYGHKAGDRLLRDVSARMKQKLRCSDVMVPDVSNEQESELLARLGGDEFLICLPGVSDVEPVKRIVERLFDAIRLPIMIEQDQVVIGASIGIACCPQSGASADELIKNADIAMYHAKANGKNTYSLFTPGMTEKVVRRAEIERELRKALADPEQFELWYQPQVNLATGELMGAEALVRWRHPLRGLIAPDEFIPAAEDTDMIIPIGEILIERLCCQLCQWLPDLPEDFYVSLNLSAKQIYRQDLNATFARYMTRYGIAARHVHVEITESLLMSDETEAKRVLDDLRRTGIQVWLDDFGTGFSSLSYLRLFPVDGVKIDRSFIAQLEKDAQDRALASAVISMARSLDKMVVSEGIENAAQVDILLEQRCELGQGYWFAKPLPPAQFAAKFLQARAACLS